MKLFGCDITCETCSIIGQFSIVWAQFELEFFENNYNVKKHFKIIIKETSDNVVKNIELVKKSLQNYAKENYDAGFNWVDKLCVRDNEKEYKDNVEKFLNGEALSLDDQIKTCIFICSRLRNNLLHGLKDIYYLNKQIKIFISAKKFLETIVNERTINVISGGNV